LEDVTWISEVKEVRSFLSINGAGDRETGKIGTSGGAFMGPFTGKLHSLPKFKHPKQN